MHKDCKAVPDYLGLQTRKIVSLKKLAGRELSYTLLTKLTTPLETLASGESPSGIAFSDSWPFCWSATVLGSCGSLLAETYSDASRLNSKIAYAYCNKYLFPSV